MSEPIPQDYKDAVNGTGPLAHEWADKPHRLVYDLVAALTVATQRAEAVEAERKEALDSLDKSRAFKNGLLIERNALRDENDGMHMTNLRIMRELAEARAEREALRAECEALRKVDDAMVERAWKYLEIIAIEKSYGMLSGIDKEYLRNALTAALAVQP